MPELPTTKRRVRLPPKKPRLRSERRLLRERFGDGANNAALRRTATGRHIRWLMGHTDKQTPGGGAMGGSSRKIRVPLLGTRFRTENLLLLFTLLAVILGTTIGLSLNPMLSGNPQGLTNRQLMYLKFPGEMFLRMLKMLIVPLVIASNISAIASLNAKAARLLTGLSVLYYVSTTIIAVVLGIVLVNLIQPGRRRHRQDSTGGRTAVSGANVTHRRQAEFKMEDSIMDLFRNMIPINLFVASFNKTTTRARDILVNYSMGNGSWDQKEDEAINSNVGVPGTNILGLITFCMLFGFAVHSLGPDAAVLADMFHAVRRVIIYLVSIVIWFSPIGIMCLIAAEIAKTNDLGGSLRDLSMYVATVMSGLIIHGMVVLPCLLLIFTRRNPIKYAYNMLQALMCALGTASSTATLPCTIRCLESGNQIDPRVTRFMLPLGTTINMDGTAIFQAIAAVYISQLMDEDLTLGETILVGMTSALASMAATSMPSAGMITIVMVLQAVGLPSDKITSLYPVDWFLDRFRTMVNVFSDSVGAAIVSRLCERKLLNDLVDLSATGLPTNSGHSLNAVAPPPQPVVSSVQDCESGLLGRGGSVVADCQADDPTVDGLFHEYAGGLREVELRDFDAALGRRRDSSAQSPILPVRSLQTTVLGNNAATLSGSIEPPRTRVTPLGRPNGTCVVQQQQQQQRVSSVTGQRTKRKQVELMYDEDQRQDGGSVRLLPPPRPTSTTTTTTGAQQRQHRARPTTAIPPRYTLYTNNAAAALDELSNGENAVEQEEDSILVDETIYIKF